MAAQDIARIASLKAEIAEIQDVWVDSDEQEQAFFALYLQDLHAEIASIRGADEQAAARKSWTRSVARAVKAVTALRVTSDLDFDARHKESARIFRNLGNAQARAFTHSLDVSSELDAVWATVAPACEAAGRWYSDRLAYRIEQSAAAARRATQRPLTAAEQQYHADLRAAFR